MEKEFVPYLESLAIKELGFDEPCFATYEFNKLQINEFKNDCSYLFCLKTEVFPAPTLSQAFRWFREKKKLFISFSRYRNSAVIKMPDTFTNVYEMWIQDENEDESIWVGVFDEHDEAELECLKKLIEIVKEKRV